MGAERAMRHEFEDDEGAGGGEADAEESDDVWVAEGGEDRNFGLEEGRGLWRDRECMEFFDGDRRFGVGATIDDASGPVSEQSGGVIGEG